MGALYVHHRDDFVTLDATGREEGIAAYAVVLLEALE